MRMTTPARLSSPLRDRDRRPLKTKRVHVARQARVPHPAIPTIAQPSTCRGAGRGEGWFNESLARTLGLSDVMPDELIWHRVCPA